MRRVMAALLLTAAGPLAHGQLPVKLDIQSEWYTVRAGDPLPVRLRLLNSANQPVKAPKRLDVLLQARLPSGEVKQLRSVPLEAGQSDKELAVALPGTGMVYLWAKHAELLPGGVFVSVRPAAAPPPQRPQVMPKRLPNPFERFPVGIAPAPAPPPPPRVSPKVALRYSPDRHFLADGKDSATVQAFLLGDAADSDIRLNLFDSSGTMQPTPLTIPRGQDAGRASLTFNQPGIVTVEFLGSSPAAQLDGDSKLRIPFMPPITHLTLEASPPAISLVDQADLVLTLRDAMERPIASDAARHITFGIQSGRGNLTSKEVDIPAGQFEARTTLEPSWLGPVVVSAATPNLLNASSAVRVTAPVMLLLCSMAGGLVGGYLSYLSLKRRRSPARRVGIGVATGFLFYWFCLFIGLAAIGHGAVVNPLSAFALSAFGGWLQTGVFALWKPQLKA